MVTEGERGQMVLGANEGDWWGFISGKWGLMMLVSVTA